MRIAYLDTASGIAGDMTLCALIDAGADPDYIMDQVGSLGLGDVRLEITETMRHCFRALRLDVKHPSEHAHRHLSDIEKLIASSTLTDRESDLALRMFRRLGEAEAKVHGTSLEQVHFHEVGAIDSIVDIVGVSVALCNLQIEQIVASPPPTGTGRIRIAHGPVDVPAPATAELLKGLPIRASDIEAELTTPTGAAILATLADGFGAMPTMRLLSTGYGAGHKDLGEQANILRVYIGESTSSTENRGLLDEESVVLLETNIDDATAEQIGFAIDQLWQAEPLDVYTTAIQMKKGRPAVMLSVLCRPKQQTALSSHMLALTGSLGVRVQPLRRYAVPREIINVSTRWGEAQAKLSWHDYGGGQTVHVSPEFESCRRLATDNQCSLQQAFRAVEAAAQEHAAGRQPPVRERSPASGYANAGGSELLNKSRTWPKYAGDPKPNADGHAHDHSHDHSGGHHHHH
ncbi:MAG TPA: nickel pincer cofactor biosynthesis protein LarC [Planctomycetaceae bacterium]|nr:nickel pincer cofactor biosynthesis protein LarC [Planctomycetaceae bacterium]